MQPQQLQLIRKLSNHHISQMKGTDSETLEEFKLSIQEQEQISTQKLSLELNSPEKIHLAGKGQPVILQQLPAKVINDEEVQMDSYTHFQPTQGTAYS